MQKDTQGYLSKSHTHTLTHTHTHTHTLTHTHTHTHTLTHIQCTQSHVTVTVTHTHSHTGADWGGKSGPGVTVRPAHSIHSARPTQYTARCPLNTRGVAHSMHRTYRPVSDLLGKIPIHLTLFWKKLHHICFFFLSHLDTPICL